MRDVLRQQKWVVFLIGFSYLLFYTTFDLAHYSFHSQFGSTYSELIDDDFLIHYAFGREKTKQEISETATDNYVVDCPFALLMNNLSSKTGTLYHSFFELKLIFFLKPKEEKPIIKRAISSLIPRAPPAFSIL
jgi:hypothetical protein